jgi:hypothetical protein
VTSSPLPQGMTDVDYEAIEAAVTETVRGRWFLKEFAARNRGAEVKLLLDAMSRLETLVASRQVALPPPPSADPSIRLMVQRIKEIAGHLEGLAGIMREEGVEAHFSDVVELQARAVAGLMRTGPAAESKPARLDPPAPQTQAIVEPARPPEPRRLPRVDAHPAAGPDPRLAALSGLDGLPLAKKLALFT